MTFRRLPPFIAAGVLVLLLATAMAASWRRTDIDDPNDTRGVLDVQTVRFWHPRGEPPEWTVLTFSRWKVRPLWDHGYVHVFFDTIGGEPPEYRVLIRSTGRALLASLWQIAKKPGKLDRFVRDLPVYRKSHDGVSVRVPLKSMTFGPQRISYNWWIVTTLSTDKCPTTCIDRAPNRGSVPQYRPGMSPSPTPSPSSAAP
jgi:hypothetical protein